MRSLLTSFRSWVFSSDLPTAEQTGHTVFDPTNSSTWTLLPGYSWAIKYVDGSGASGIVGTDTVNVGGVTVTSQAVEAATSVSTGFASGTANDGLLGLAMDSANTGMFDLFDHFNQDMSS